METWKDFARFALCSLMVAGPVVLVVRSAPGADRAQFVQDVQRATNGYSALEGVKACAAVGTDGNGHLGAVIEPQGTCKRLPDGMRPIGITLRSE